MTESVTPNDLPGAAPADTASVDPVAPKDGALTPEKTGMSADEVAELNRLRKIHADESKWEKRAKANFEDAEKLRSLMKELGGDKAAEFDPKAELDKLRNEVLSERTERIRADVARTEKVPPKYVLGSTEEEMRASAEEYRNDLQQLVEEAIKATGKTPAAPPASTVTSDGKIAGPEQITSREQLNAMPPQEILKAQKEGRLDHLMGKKP